MKPLFSNHESDIVNARKLKTQETISPTITTSLQLPKDVNEKILNRLNVVDIVTSASVVCTQWWKLSKDPSMWRTIDMRNNSETSNNDLVNICMYAINRSCGQVEEIYIENFGNDQLLQYIGDM